MRKVIIVVHQKASSPGQVGQALGERGYVLDRRCPNLGDPLPDCLEDCAGVVVFGGPMSANDCGEMPGIRCELEWIPKVLAAGIPYLGVCLGGQLLARALGGMVTPHPAGHREIGYHEIRPTPAGTAVFGSGPLTVYQWHKEGFSLPAGATLLAQGERFPHQAFRYGSAYALQFHPESNDEIVNRWSTLAKIPLDTPGVQDQRTQFRLRRRYEQAMHQWLEQFLDHWLDTAEQPAQAAVG
ncbi:MAG: glutamine amidotransferase [Alphaproteobacteria bacterium]|nr:glutamine amidotransferase [Alphaproteobacteria bacterium]